MVREKKEVTINHFRVSSNLVNLKKLAGIQVTSSPAARWHKSLHAFSCQESRNSYSMPAHLQRPRGELRCPSPDPSRALLQTPIEYRISESPRTLPGIRTTAGSVPLCKQGESATILYYNSTRGEICMNGNDAARSAHPIPASP